MTDIIMHGCNGHMGRVITDIVSKDENCRIVAGIDPFDDGHNDYPVFPSIDACDVKADVIIDFAAAAAEDALLDYSVAKNIPVVVCTTGLSDEQLAHVRSAACKVAVLKSANMSLGINTLFGLLQEAAKVLVPAGFDVEVVEQHHNKKLDAPSGTALALADSIKKVLGDNPEIITCRPADLIPDELDTLRKECEQWIQQDEDVLSYALFPQVAVDFFKYREAQQTKVDATVADTENGSYPVQVFGDVKCRSAWSNATSGACNPQAENETVK